EWTCDWVQHPSKGTISRHHSHKKAIFLEKAMQNSDDDPSTSRVERLRVERLKLTCDQAVKNKGDEPSTSGLSALQQPVILDADRFPLPPANDEDSSFQECQVDGLLRIFEYLTLKERVRLSQTCRRFHELLTDNKASSIRGLTVLNMFQRKVWEKSVQNNAISSLTILNISSTDHIVSLLRHVRTIDCLKIWYRDSEFVDAVLDAFNDSVLVRNVDVYPYGGEIALDKVSERFPKVHAITMRPHGNTYFYNGIRIPSMPDFSHLSILCMDSFEPLPGFAFPQSVKSLDFGHRKLRNMRYLFDALAQLNLTYLSLSHLKFDDYSIFAELIFSMARMRRLDVLVLKFCHLMDTGDSRAKEEDQMALRAIQLESWKRMIDTGDMELSVRQLHFDLCHDVGWMALYSFTVLSQKTLKNLSVSLLYEDESHFISLLSLTPLLHRLNVTISLSVMQKDTLKIESIKAPPELPLEFHDVVSRFEASYLVLPHLMQSIFGMHCRNLQDCKFIVTRGLNDAILEMMSMNCPHLKKLSIIKCSEVTDEGLLFFATNVSQRKTSAPLKILYKNNGPLVGVYGTLVVQKTKRETIHYYTKTFQEVDKENFGECLYFKNQTLNRTVIYKNYTPEDSNHLLGLVIDIEDYLNESSVRNWTRMFNMDSDSDLPESK
ncbi:hypothetical protein PENTCL1PPCAC_25903, partial [Pristionchus entomophagus]